MPATTRRKREDREKNKTSVHLRPGRIDSAYAAGIARTRTSSVATRLAVSEFSRDGQGLVPVPTPKKEREPSRGSGARTEGGLVAAPSSLWNDASPIHSTGPTNKNPVSQAGTAT